MKNTLLKDYISDRTNYITNIDPDGLFTYVLINHFFKGKLVGFTNSKDYVYLLDGLTHSGKTVTYIDMFVTNPSVHSIDQHIITRNPQETKSLKQIGTKLNPNLLFEQDLIDYRHKFPLSTFLFIIILLGRETDLSINWHKKIEGTDLELGHFLLDIDGVLTNLRDYNANIKSWMDKLLKECYSDLLQSLYDYINTIPILELKTISDKVRSYLNQTFQTETKDGGYKTINKDNVTYIENIIKFASKELFNEEITTNIDIHGMDIWKGERKIDNCNNIKLNETFSYAIVRANDNNLSYTTKLVKI